MAEADAPVFIVSLDNSSNLIISDDYSAHDNDADNTTIPIEWSKRVSFAERGSFSIDEGNCNPVAETLAQLSMVSFTTSDRSSATTDYGSFALARELSLTSSIRTSTSTGR